MVARSTVTPPRLDDRAVAELYADHYRHNWPGRLDELFDICSTHDIGSKKDPYELIIDIIFDYGRDDAQERLFKLLASHYREKVEGLIQKEQLKAA